MTQPENNEPKVELTAEQMEALMEGNIDDVENLPDYITPPAGFYKLLVKTVDRKKDMKGKKCIHITFSVQEAIQLNNPAEEKPKEGSLFSQAYFPDTSVENLKDTWRWVKKA